MKLEILILRRSTMFQFPFRLSRHIRGFKLYIPGFFVAVNNVTPPPAETVDVGIEPEAAAALARFEEATS